MMGVMTRESVSSWSTPGSVRFHIAAVRPSGPASDRRPQRDGESGRPGQSLVGTLHTRVNAPVHIAWSLGSASVPSLVHAPAERWTAVTLGPAMSQPRVGPVTSFHAKVNWIVTI